MNVALFASLAVALMAPVLAGSSALQAESAAIQLARAPSRDQKDSWVDRLTQARRTVEKARVEEADSKATYGRMRAKRKLRGEARVEVTQERDRAHQARIDAERKLEILLERARRGGVPPGWVREAMDGFEDSPPASAL